MLNNLYLICIFSKDRRRQAVLMGIDALIDAIRLFGIDYTQMVPKNIPSWVFHGPSRSWRKQYQDLAEYLKEYRYKKPPEYNDGPVNEALPAYSATAEENRQSRRMKRTYESVVAEASRSSRHGKLIIEC